MSTGSRNTKVPAQSAAVADDVPPWERQPAGDVSEAAPAMSAEEINERQDAQPDSGPVEAFSGLGGGHAISPTQAVQILMNYLASKATESEGDSASAIEQMIAEVMLAETAEEVLEESSTTAGEDIVGVPIRLMSVKFRESDLDGSLPYYALIEAFRADTKTVDIITCGGFKVVAQLARLDMLDALSGRVVILRKSERPTRQGNYPLHLEYAA